MIKEEELTSQGLLEAVSTVDSQKEEYRKTMEASGQQNAVVKVADIIEKVVDGSK